MSISHNFISVVLLVSLTRADPLLKNVGISEDIDIQADDTDYRLPTNVKPSHYAIKLVPNIALGEFSGESSITITLTEYFMRNITLHAKDLKIDEAFTTLVEVANPKNKVHPNQHSIDIKRDFLILTFDILITGNYILNLKYTGKLRDDLNGFYRSSYLNWRGEKVWLATTQFEPTHARLAFPCFDEPALKAKFEISINHYKNFSAVSNMPFKNIDIDKENLAKQWTNFDVTPPMSTYLVAFVVSDFESLTSDDGKFSVWSKPNDIHKGHYAHSFGQKALAALDKYTGIKHYDFIPKMDNFAIPDFRAGAMENWGIVTYRESGLLYEENVTSTGSKQGIATVISHEFAHQWFGNLVSPLWWDYTWLNEGFANYFQYYITDQIKDTWRLMDQFVVKNLQETAFTADDKESQHAMNGKVNSPLEISAFFDSITYSKAGCVIRMISHAFTEAAFQNGLKAYLNNNKNHAVTSDALFDALASAAMTDKTKAELINALTTWATQPGYPVITVIRDYKAKSASISQHRFLTQKSKESTETWVIPINYAQSKSDFTDTKPSSWLTSKVNENITIPSIAEGWVIFNKQQTGYYRVNYDGENWSLIEKCLNSNNYTNIHVLNRAQILDDAFHLAQAGELKDHSVFLDISRYLKEEVDYVPWHAAFRAFAILNKALAKTDQHTLLKLYVLRLIEKLEKSVGYNETDKDDHVTKFNRINAINWACYVGSKNCTTAAHEKLVEHVLGSSKISTDLQTVVLCAGIRAANATIWEKTFEMYEKTKDETERKAILTALGCSTDSKVLNSLLAKCIADESKISPNSTIKAVLDGSTSGIDIAFDFISSNLTKIVKIDNGTDSVLKILNEIGSRMTTEAQVDKLKLFINANENLAKDLKAKALVSATENIAWIKNNKEKIGAFFKAQKLVDTPPAAKPNNSPSASLPALQLILLAFVACVVSRIH